MVKEGVDERNQFIRLLDSISIGERPLDVQCSVEYFNNHCQVYTSLSDVFRQYEFVLFILKGIVEENLHGMIHSKYLKNLTRYIEQCEIEKCWFILMENTYRFPVVDYYMKVLKFELLQYSFNDCMYLLKVRCLNFTERDVRNTIDIVQYFFSGCFDRTSQSVLRSSGSLVRIQPDGHVAHRSSQVSEGQLHWLSSEAAERVLE